MKFEVFIGLGSNLGDKKLNLETARTYISQEIGEINRISSLYETEPWGDKNQDNFYNQVIKIETEIFPLALIEKCLAIEINMGRVRIQKWAARIIDIDILAISGIQFRTDNLTVPHAYLHARKFVLLPWAEIAPQYIPTGLSASISNMCDDIQDDSWIKKVQMII
jgi:2-amino-4-hydroxy-6-hydroxymethyldihydropteridine diphosphokinase